MRRTLH